jgi:hypothetical protein
MAGITKYVAHRNDSGENGEVLLIDFENNYANIKFYTTDNKYYYEKSYDLDDEDIEITQSN